MAFSRATQLGESILLPQIMAVFQATQSVSSFSYHKPWPFADAELNNPTDGVQIHFGPWGCLLPKANGLKSHSQPAALFCKIYHFPPAHRMNDCKTTQKPNARQSQSQTLSCHPPRSTERPIDDIILTQIRIRNAFFLRRTQQFNKLNHLMSEWILGSPEDPTLHFFACKIGYQRRGFLWLSILFTDSRLFLADT